MIRIIDTYEQINSLFIDGKFCFREWETYINSIYDGASEILQKDIKVYFESGNFTFEDDFLPIINGVYQNSALDVLHDAFVEATMQLNKKVITCFGKELDIEIVFYVGLCNAAGWATNINGIETILLGVEKILELGWQNYLSVRALIYHELGHAYHKKYGIYKQVALDNRQKAIWLLFTEGIAMHFEQRLVGDSDYYHQDKNGWRNWCEEHFLQILVDFDADSRSVDVSAQKYFWDWANYYGYGDVGYYLGAQFVNYLAATYGFEELIQLRIEDVCKLYSVYYLKMVK